MRYDVCVVGAGSGGFGAALAAARSGLKVLILEKTANIGGNANRCGVNCWEPVAGATGFPREIYRRLRSIPLATAVYGYGRHFLWDGRDAFPGGEHVIYPYRDYPDTLRRHGIGSLAKSPEMVKRNLFGVVFEPAAYETVLRQMLADTGNSSIVFSSWVDTVTVGNGSIQGIVLNDGTEVSADYYIDGTGDGVLCRLAGCDLVIGEDAKETYNEHSAPAVPTDRINAATLIFRITRKEVPGIDPIPPEVSNEQLPAECWWQENYPFAAVFFYPNGDRNVNMLPTMDGREYMRLGHDRAYVECRKRASAWFRYVQSEYDEFRRYRIHSLSPSIGIREGYRVITDYTLTENDILRGFSKDIPEDRIAIADHAFDRHGVKGGAKELDEPFPVPFRCLLPKGYKNLLIACRAAGFSSIAASSTRLSRTLMQLGQAAGNACAIAKDAGGITLPDVDPAELRKRLLEQNVQLDFPAG